MFIEAKNDGGDGDNWTTGAINRAKLQSNHYHQQTSIQSFLQAGCPSCRPAYSVTALKGKYHIPWTCLPQAHLGVFQLCLWPLIAPGYLGGGLPCLLSALCTSTPVYLDNTWFVFMTERFLLRHGFTVLCKYTFYSLASISVIFCLDSFALRMYRVHVCYSGLQQLWMLFVLDSDLNALSHFRFVQALS